MTILRPRRSADQHRVVGLKYSSAMGLSERQKMLSGERYNCHDPSARAWPSRHTGGSPCSVRAIRAMPKNGSGCSVRSSDVERGTHIEPPLYADFGVHTTIGEDTFINVNCVIVDDAAISIGKRRRNARESHPRSPMSSARG